MVHRECQLLIAQAYAAWAMPAPTRPHLHRQCIAEYYAAMQGRARRGAI